MAQTLSAPSGTAVGATVAFPDGTTTTVDANGNISCPDNFSAAMLNAGFNYAAADAGQQSSALSSTVSAAVAPSSQASSVAALSPASMSSQASSIAAVYGTTSSTASSWAAIAGNVSSIASRTKSSFSW